MGVGCLRTGCQYHQQGRCINASPTITLMKDGTGKCWSCVVRRALPPCPYCGSYDVYLDTENGYIVLCATPGCQAHSTNPFSNREEAIAAWRKRA